MYSPLHVVIHIPFSRYIDIDCMALGGGGVGALPWTFGMGV